MSIVKWQMLVKGAMFRLEDELPREAKFLLEDFRLAVNNAIRIGSNRA